MPFRFKSAKKRILIVEDDWAILEVLKLMLEHEGYAVTTAKHGREAIAIAATKPFDMVLMDISMPEMNGIEVAQTLRAREQTANLLIGIHTGLDEHWVRERFADYDLFLTKATDTDVLVDAIAKLFALPTASRERRAAAQQEQSFSADELQRAREALRTEMGLGTESMTTSAFVAQLAEEIDQLRSFGRSDGDIAAMISSAIDRDIAPTFLQRDPAPRA